MPLLFLTRESILYFGRYTARCETARSLYDTARFGTRDNNDATNNQLDEGQVNFGYRTDNTKTNFIYLLIHRCL